MNVPKRRNMENMLIWLIDIFCILCSGALAFGIRYGRLCEPFSMETRYGW
ncbi:MAG: hypothetical protein V8R61_11840 [Enterocloster sp.]